jgi:methylated-DNA-[protein]-cysteine S-methyltransferase
VKSMTLVDSPLGPLTLVGDDDALVGLYMVDQRHRPALEHLRDDSRLPAVKEQLTAYWEGDLTHFDLPVMMTGTLFQQEVWAALTTIPYGQTWSYGQLATAIGRPGASRAVGLANGRNPISVVVPCHRVVGSTGSMTGYGGGLERKKWLLDLERGRV